MCVRVYARVWGRGFVLMDGGNVKTGHYFFLNFIKKSQIMKTLLLILMLLTGVGAQAVCPLLGEEYAIVGGCYYGIPNDRTISSFAFELNDEGGISYTEVSLSSFRRIEVRKLIRYGRRLDGGREEYRGKIDSLYLEVYRRAQR